MSDFFPVTPPLNRPVRLGVLISGGGTTMVNFAEKIESGMLDAEIVQVIASRDCAGLEKARERRFPCETISRRDFADAAEYSRALFARLRSARVDLVVFAGFLTLLEIPDDFPLRVMNIHPALIPAFCGHGFYGEKVHAAVLERGVKVSGCTVHFADNVYDHGPIILQRVVPVEEDDTPQSLAARVFTAECEAYPEAVQLFAQGRLWTDGTTVRIR